MAVYPAMTTETIAATMDNFRLFVPDYNAKVVEENIAIANHNSEVFTNIKDLNPVQAGFRRAFMLKYGKWVNYLDKKTLEIKERYQLNDMNARQYNALATEFCNEYGNIVELMPLQTIKYSTEMFFMNFLHAYNGQLSKKNAIHMKMDIAYKKPLPPVEINSLQITNLMRNGVKAINVCKKTVINHRKRLEEAGILVDYVYQGFYRGTLHQFNPEILQIIDLATGKNANTENQSISSKKRKNLAEFNETTRTKKNECEIKENVENNSLSKRSSLGSSLTSFNSTFYRNTDRKMQKISPEGAAKIVKTDAVDSVELTVSEKLQRLIVHPQQLAEELASGEHWDYSPIDIRVLFREAYEGTLTTEEFKQLLIQDFLKTSAKIWRGKRVFVGSWKNTINVFYDSWFMNGKFTFSKQNQFDYLKEYRWRINHARKWFLSKPDFNPLFPSDYFDRSRTDRKEVGFGYTSKAWNRHLKYMENRAAKQRKAENKTQTRKQSLSAAKAVEAKIKMYLKGRVSVENLYIFVQNKYPAFLDNLSSMVWKIQSSNLKNNN
ncbi:hypothetical protein [Flavobacterium cerinum]|uniref:Uncharacterized protein n=1 Tax=Flavobacterium cerinum TaxID=2502784 RepID=A0ABY5IVS6_9FLAO|nr:hypothetical protein [Flavobacterium cerinum]UUC45561.1 hypothetical protein NOX80_18315 [Flavobacterium cerinum]